MIDSSRTMKRLYGTTDPIEAEVLRALLRDAGIESALDNEGGAAYAVGLPTSISPLGIHVSDEDAAAAAEVLARHFEKKDAEDLEPDPDAPPPMSDEESARFSETIEKGKPSRRFVLAFFWLLPTFLTVFVYMLRKRWEAAGVAALVFLAILAAGWMIHTIAGLGRKKKRPAP